MRLPLVWPCQSTPQQQLAGRIGDSPHDLAEADIGTDGILLWMCNARSLCGLPARFHCVDYHRTVLGDIGGVEWLVPVGRRKSKFAAFAVALKFSHATPPLVWPAQHGAPRKVHRPCSELIAAR